MPVDYGVQKPIANHHDNTDAQDLTITFASLLARDMSFDIINFLGLKFKKPRYLYARLYYMTFGRKDAAKGKSTRFKLPSLQKKKKC